MLIRTVTWLLIVLTAAPAWVSAQSSAEQNPFKQEELDQILAPIALYPDDLLSQVLMASTYPLEVVQAERWAKQNKSLKGDALATALEKQAWDPSVKSLVNFPDVLTMMSEKLDWTEKLGNAFLAQQKEVMGTVQKLRGKAQETGNLKTTAEQKVVVEKETQVIVIESANPQVVYVPTYNPTVVYGTWAYPSYPPYYYYPPNYAATAAFSFMAGAAVGAAWGYAWGDCNWGGGDVDIDVNRNTNINNNIDRSKYRSNVSTGQGKWQHNAEHRKGVPYRDQATSQRYNRGGSTQAAQNREAFRGRADQGGQNLSGSGGNRGAQTGQMNRSASAGTREAGSLNRSAGSSSSQIGGAGRQNVSSRDSAFQGASSGSQARNFSSRGSSSRQSMSAGSGGGGGRGGGGRGGGGRGGGGRGGGGRGGGRR